MISNAKLTEAAHPVVALAPTSNPSGVSPAWVSLKNYNRCTIIIQTANDGTGASSAITINQATSVAGAGSKALAFTVEDQVADVSAGDTFTVTTVSSNTFNTANTASKNGLYVIEVRASDLDQANNFAYIQVGIGNNAHSVVSALYILRDARYPQSTDTAVSAVV